MIGVELGKILSLIGEEFGQADAAAHGNVGDHHWIGPVAQAIARIGIGGGPAGVRDTGGFTGQPARSPALAAAAAPAGFSLIGW